MQNVKITILEQLLNFIAPHICCGCGQIGQLLCSSCEYDIMGIQHSSCLMCEKPAANGICAQHGKYLDFAWCVGYRSGVLQNLIGGYKFGNVRGTYKILASLLRSKLPADLPADTVIVPVPTIRRHIRERGYDHLDLIARQLSHLKGLRTDKIIERRGDFVQHHAISRAQRQDQARDMFAIAGKINASTTYLIVDDVVTTGSTIKNIARLLKEAGASKVNAAVIAYQPLD